MAEADGTVPFGAEMRKLFNFADSYTPLNHGAYGTFPRHILEKQQDFQRQYESRPSVFETHTYPALVKESRAAIAPLLGADVSEVGFVRNASTGTGLMLGNIKYEEGDVILHFDTIYGACMKNMQFLEEMTVVRRKPISVTLPATFEEIVQKFKDAIQEVKDAGLNPKVAVFDTIVSQPGFKLPWEDMVKICREAGILSAVDAAHAVGHIDMSHTGEVSPDFLVSNCHKCVINLLVGLVFSYAGAIEKKRLTLSQVALCAPRVRRALRAGPQPPPAAHDVSYLVGIPRRRGSCQGRAVQVLC